MIINKNLYQQIVRVMPIPCVDLVVVDNLGLVLLAKRTNEPAIGEWWFPGGRVHYLESRSAAATRKLREECGLESDQLIEMSTYDVMVERADDNTKSHAITTLYIAKVRQHEMLTMDAQTSEAEWRLPHKWLKLELNPFIRKGLTTFIQYKGL
jgi:ADP-ribose pyrophosphatase YjhB (NUDIX family)